MPDEKTSQGTEMTLQQRAAELRGTPQEVLAQAREAAAGARALVEQKTQGSVALAKADWDAGSREQYRALAELGHPTTSRNETGVAPVQSLGASKGADIQKVEQGTSVPEPSATAAKYRGTAPEAKTPSPEMQKFLETRREQVAEASRGLQQSSAKVQDPESRGTASVAPAQKSRGNEGRER